LFANRASVCLAELINYMPSDATGTHAALQTSREASSAMRNIHAACRLTATCRCQSKLHVDSA